MLTSGGAAAAPPKGGQSFDMAPLLKNQVINKRSVKEHNYRGKAGQSNAVCSENVRTSIEVFVAVLEEGKWGK